MLRMIFLGLISTIIYFFHGVDNKHVGRKERGWLIFKESGGVLFAQDSIPDKINVKEFFKKYQYLKGIDVTNYRSIYEFEGRATRYRVTFWGDNTFDYIKVIPAQVEVFSRKSSLGTELNSWSFKGVKDSTIILFNSPDTLYVSNICPYKKKTGDCYAVQVCSK